MQKKTLLRMVISNFSLKFMIKIYGLRVTSFGELVINLQKTYFNMDCILSEILKLLKSPFFFSRNRAALMLVVKHCQKKTADLNFEF